MAKPGSNGARRFAARALDLAARGMTDEQAAEVQEVIELKAGMRCCGCGRRITLGFHFTSIDPRKPEHPIVRLAACTREDCDFAEKCRDGGSVVEAIEFAWLDPAGADARPADMAKLGVTFLDS